MWILPKKTTTTKQLSCTSGSRGCRYGRMLMVVEVGLQIHSVLYTILYMFQIFHMNRLFWKFKSYKDTSITLILTTGLINKVLPLEFFSLLNHTLIPMLLSTTIILDLSSRRKLCGLTFCGLLNISNIKLKGQVSWGKVSPD